MYPIPTSQRHRAAAARRFVFASLMLLAAGAAGAAEPHTVVSDVIDRVMARLDETPNTDGAVLELFEAELSPHLAFDTITRWVSGKRWEDFSDAERGDMVAAVSEHVVHVYASLLARGHDVDISIEQNSTVQKRSARVGATLALSDGQQFVLEFRLLRDGESWKLYDLVVDGLSFARTLRAELNPVIMAGGVRGLQQYLAEHRAS
ncbi:MAG: MlaC/ttg2D family ABC transporter substrate-binding protein [Gammaproteobacteria bacterium]